jgi:branched-chain amino acid transport system permease protein
VTQVLINSLSGACLNLLIAVSFWLVYAPTKTFYISHAAAITVGAYGCYWLNRTGLPFIPAVGLAAIAAALGFATIETWLFQRLRTSSKGWIGLVASFGLYVVLQNSVSLCFGDETLVLHPRPITVGQRIAGAYLADAQKMMIVVGAVLFASTLILLFATKLGRQIRGVASNPELCILLGINPARIVCSAFAIGSALAAVAGVLAGLDSNITPTMGFRLLMNGVVVMIIAGPESLSGFVRAALLLALAQHFAAYFLDAKWMDAIAFLILIGFLVWKPLGFSGGRLKKGEI